MRAWMRRHRVLATAIGTVSAVILVTAAANIWVRSDASTHEYNATDAPPAPVALVLGAGLRPDGAPSPYLQDRLEDALALFRGGKVPHCWSPGTTAPPPMTNRQR